MRNSSFKIERAAKGGRARAVALSTEERSAIAKKAALARWSRPHPQGKHAPRKATMTDAELIALAAIVTANSHMAHDANANRMRLDQALAYDDESWVCPGLPELEAELRRRGVLS